MAYIKTSWVARVGTALNRFLKTNESAGSVELTNDPTGVTTAGTPFTVANMNKIEQGIYDAHVVLDDNINQNVKTTASPTFANATIAGHNIDSELDTLNGRVNQGVKTTDSPTFASVNTGHGSNEIYKLSREDIDFGSGDLPVTRTISPMVSYEMRMIFIKGTITGGATRTMSLNLPSDGSYYVGSLTTERGTSSGVFIGGSTIVTFSTSGGSEYIDRTVLVWKV